MPSSSNRAGFPAKYVSPSKSAWIPFPVRLSNAEISSVLTPASSAASTIASAIGCSLRASRLAATDSTDSRDSPPVGTTSVTVSSPCVSVPVLSNAAAVTVPTDSRCVPPLMRTPFFAALVIPETTLTGVLMTSAHGQDRTRSANPRLNHVAQSPANTSDCPLIPRETEPSIRSGGTAAMRTASVTTTGVYWPANRSTNCSCSVLSLCASSTSSMMRASVLSSASAVTSTSR